MSLAESQRILTNPFQDYSGIPLESQKPLSGRSDDSQDSWADLRCLSKTTCFTPKTKTEQDPSQESWAGWPSSQYQEGEASPPAVQTEVECFEPSHRSVSQSFSQWSGSHVCPLGTVQVA